jgi:hypothetical protein
VEGLDAEEKGGGGGGGWRLPTATVDTAAAAFKNTAQSMVPMHNNEKLGKSAKRWNIKITLKRRRHQPSQSLLLLIVIINTFTGIHRRALIICFTSACDAFTAISFCQLQ